MEDPHNEVIAVDNCFSGDKRNLQKWFGNPRFEFIRHDVCLPLTVEVRIRVARVAHTSSSSCSHYAMRTG